MNILEEAKKIMDERSEEKNREYGPFDESLERAALIASQLIGKEISTIDFMKCMIALKISRMRYNIKEDTMLDAVAYIHGLNEYHKKLQAELGNLPFKSDNTTIIGKKFVTHVSPTVYVVDSFEVKSGLVSTITGYVQGETILTDFNTFSFDINEITFIKE